MRPRVPALLPRRRAGPSAATGAEGEPRAGFSTASFLCCPLSHMLVIIANSAQLVLMLIFLTMLLFKLNDDDRSSWMAVFTPLWISDAITFLTAAQELRRTYHATSLASE